MSYRNDELSDVVAVLTLVRDEFKKRSSYINSTELRKDAVKAFAETELKAKRYKNQDSALKTIHDACARRLKPDVNNIRDFDVFVDQWLRQKSVTLKEILLKHCENKSQRAMVISFFSEIV